VLYLLYCRCLVLVIVYLVGGVLLMHYWRGARGVEQIPNYEFWIAFPGLVKVVSDIEFLHVR